MADTIRVARRPAAPSAAIASSSLSRVSDGWQFALPAVTRAGDRRTRLERFCGRATLDIIGIRLLVPAESLRLLLFQQIPQLGCFLRLTA